MLTKQEKKAIRLLIKCTLAHRQLFTFDANCGKRFGESSSPYQQRAAKEYDDIDNAIQIMNGLLNKNPLSQGGIFDDDTTKYVSS